jgi:sulfoxide reductase catalytic subunit YedY
MPIIHRRSWEIPESQATPEHIYMNRRALLGGAATLAASMMWPAGARADADPTSDLYPARRSEKYTLDRELTPENKASYYNNFYEYGTDKHIASRAQKLKTRPWTVKFDGMVENEMTVGIDELIRAMPLEERLYRMRCVEAWSMAVPWTGFAMAKLVAFAKPLSSAKYVRMETFNDSSMAPEQQLPLFPWPYVEGLTMAEANNELTFMVTGIYGKPAVKQHGAPLRLITPWK